MEKIVNYSNHLVAFIDVLGFREMIREKNLSKIETFLKTSEFSRMTLPQKLKIPLEIEMVVPSHVLGPANLTQPDRLI